MIDAHPALDAEKTATQVLRDRFRPPPEMKQFTSRNTLLVGARGSGKTMLLRWLRHESPGIAIYGDLRKILSPVSTDTGLGGLAWGGISPHNEQAAAAKSVSCLALWFLRECEKRSVFVPDKVFRRTLPRELRKVDLSDSAALYEDLSYAGLEVFARGPTAETLFELIAEVSNSSGCGQWMLLLDRAEEVPYPALGLILSLLDQSHCFKTILATRPGLISMKVGAVDLPIPGDHYTVIHQGAAPYSHAWQKFQSDILISWLPRTMESIPSEYRLLLARLSRDCLRSGLKLAHSGIGENGEFDPNLFHAGIKNLQDNLLGAAQGYLRSFNCDIRNLLRTIRKDLKNGFRLPLLIQYRTPGQPLLRATGCAFGDLSVEEQLVYIALRAGLLTTKHEVPWHPYSTFHEFELNPMLIWQEGDIWLDM